MFGIPLLEFLILVGLGLTCVGFALLLFVAMMRICWEVKYFFFGHY